MRKILLILGIMCIASVGYSALVNFNMNDGRPDPDALKNRGEPESANDAVPATLEPQASSPNYFIDWMSIDDGGAIRILGTNYSLGVTVAQNVAGHVTGTKYQMGLGFWYVIAGTCSVALTGDVNEDGAITSADIIAMVNYVFKGGAPPKPCEAAGDVNCSGSVTSADIIYLVGFVFKGGPAPCDVCTMIPGTWNC